MTQGNLAELESRLNAAAITGREIRENAEMGSPHLAWYALGQLAENLSEINGLLAAMLPVSRPEPVPVHPQSTKETA